MKKHKFFKALGVGAVATLGLFTFAGCSLSDSEKLMLWKGLKMQIVIWKKQLIC